MKAVGHAMGAAVAWLAVAPAVVQPGEHWQVLAGLPIAMATSAGVPSPDLDNRKWFKRYVDKPIPDESLGGGGPLAHRGLVHSWMLPAFVWWRLYADGLLSVPVICWTLLPVLVAWLSHDVLDGMFGQCGFGTEQGVPLVLWYFHAGLGLKSDGVTAKLATVALAGGAAWLLATRWWLGEYPAAVAVWRAVHSVLAASGRTP